MIPSHLSEEPAAKMILEELGLTPIIHGKMALGEGSGAVAFLPLLDMAINIFLNMPTFGDINIEDYKPL